MNKEQPELAPKLRTAELDGQLTTLVFELQEKRRELLLHLIDNSFNEHFTAEYRVSAQTVNKFIYFVLTEHKSTYSPIHLLEVLIALPVFVQLDPGQLPIVY